MAQTNTIVMANESGLAFRGHLNEALQAITTEFSGAAEPMETYPRMLWLDTSVDPPVQWRRNEADTGWDDVTPPAGIQFKEEGVDLGTPGTVSELNFTGDGIRASRVGDVVEISSPSGGCRNKVDNGCFRINQRGVTGTVSLAAGAHGHDRWKAGAGGCTYTFVKVANTTTITISSGSLLQVVDGENLRTGSYVLTWGGTAQGRVGSGAYGASGTVWSQTGGANTPIEFSAGTLHSVQYEEGVLFTPFELRQIASELQNCQRYYIRAGAGGVGYAISSTNIACQVSFPVEMRDVPVVSGIAGSGANLVLRVGGSQESVNVFSSVSANKNRGAYLYGSGGGYTVGMYHVMNNFAECSADI